MIDEIDQNITSKANTLYAVTWKTEYIDDNLSLKELNGLLQIREKLKIINATELSRGAK